MEFVIVTGMSGSGKSSAVNVLEDIGYYCIDNIPPELMIKFAEICIQSEGKIEKAAFVADIRSGDMFLTLKDIVKEMRERDFKLKILYLDSTDDVIVRRYKETRRRHPLDEASGGNIRNAIAREREMLVPIKLESITAANKAKPTPIQKKYFERVLSPSFMESSCKVTEFCIA